MDRSDDDKYESMSGIPERDIFVAIKFNNPLLLCDILNCLQESGRYWIDCRGRKSGGTPLHVCAAIGDIQMMRILCERWRCPKMNFEISDFNGKKCLHDAAQACQPIMVEYLIKQGSKIDSLKDGDWTPLMLACTKVGKPAINTINTLLKHGANIQLKNNEGWSPLHVAVRQGDTEIISLLIRRNADTSALTKNGSTVLHIAAFSSQLKALQLLLNNYQLSIDHKNSAGITALHSAAVGGCVDVARLLISKGACINQVDGIGMSILHLAAEAGHDDMVNYLVKECGMNVNIQAEGTGLTPLHCASRGGKISTAKILLDLGASVH